MAILDTTPYPAPYMEVVTPFGEPPLEEEEEEEIPEPSISVDADDGDGVEDGNYGRFVIGPLEAGYGHTLANPLRRVLYNGLEGAAVTSVKIEGVQHEYQTIPDIKEQVTEILLNVKAIRLRAQVDTPGKLRLEVAGIGKVSAGDIMDSSGVEVVNPELHLATLEPFRSSDAKLSLELNVERGKGYREAQLSEGLPIGVLPVDAVFTPIRKVNYTVAPARVGRRTNFENLIMEIWTDGSISPTDAIRDAADMLVNRFFMFSNLQRDGEDGAADGASASVQIPADHYKYQIERLHLSSRTLNCLKRAGVDTVGQVLETPRDDLLKIRNFGEKSYTELYDKLRNNDLLPPGLDPALMEDGSANGAGEEGDDPTESGA